MNRHLTDDELIDRLYGLNEDGGHLAACETCAARWKAVELRRRELAPAEPVSSDFLAAQRRKIHARLGEGPSVRLKWIPALAAAGVLAVVMMVYRPAAAPAPHTDPGDAQLFAEVYSMEQSTEPQAAAPIHELFEDNQ